MSPAAFVLHPRLVTATRPVGDLAVSRVLLLDDRRYPWLLLVPRRAGVEEIVDLAPADRAVVIEEMATCEAVSKDLFKPFRLNVADIGNKAEQLHIHIVARQTDDEAWPAVVWSRPPLETYRSEDDMEGRLAALRAAFAGRDPAFVALSEHTDPGVEAL